MSEVCGPCRHGLHSRCETDQCGDPSCDTCVPCGCEDCGSRPLSMSPDTITVAEYDALPEADKGWEET